MADVLTRLWLLTGDDAYSNRVEALFRAFGGDEPSRLAIMPSLLSGFLLYDHPVQVVVVGQAEATDTRDMCRALFGASATASV